MGILRFILGLLGFGGGGWVTAVTDAITAKANATTERERIASDERIAFAQAQLALIQSAQQHRVFWVAWAIAALPMAAWFGWGVLDTLFNGGLPDVAALPPQLKEYGDSVWANIFYTGGAVAGVSTATRAIATAITARRASAPAPQPRRPDDPALSL